jgi:lysophospholipase L1-like esterase
MRRFVALTAVALTAALWHAQPLPYARAAAADCTRTHTGRVPVTDLGAGSYMGAQGGLYPGGVNQRPRAHNSAGLFLATNRVKPRNASGAIDQTNGRVGLISIGMSNTTQEFQQFITLAQGDPAISGKVSIVDGAQGSQDAIAWSTPTAPPWTVLANRLSQAGLAPLQVQVVWLKEQIAGDNLGAFPGGAQTLRDRLRDIVTIARSKYPNLRIAYLSSRSYGDYNGPTRGKGAYEQAFAVKWLIQDQINGDARLAYTDAGPAPWLAWSTYLWADGLGADDQVGGIPGRSDGLEWLCGDFQSDGIHPSTSGRNKVATMLLSFLKADTTATPWFRAS